MSARVERTVPVKRVRTEEVIVNFDAERLKAPFLLRCGAFLIDYIVSVTVPVLTYLLSHSNSLVDVKWSAEIINIGWLVTILLLLTNFIVLPLISGQTFGKLFSGLRIVTANGTKPSLFSLFLRHLIGYPLSLLLFGLGFLLPILNEQGRALHDFLAGTVVVYGKQSRIIKN